MFQMKIISLACQKAGCLVSQIVNWLIVMHAFVDFYIIYLMWLNVKINFHAQKKFALLSPTFSKKIQWT